MAEPAADGADADPTGCYLYGVVAAPPPALDVAGVDGAPVVFVEGGDGLAAAVSRVALDRPPGRSAELRAHSRVVEALADAAPVVPAQFGALMADEGQVVDEVLAPDTAELHATLERIAGCRQFIVRASYVEERVLAEVMAEDPRVADLSERTREASEQGSHHPDLVRLGELVAAAVERKRAVDAEAVLAVARPHCRAVDALPGSGTTHVCRAALLVPDESVEDLLIALEDHAELVHGRVGVELSGPTAPWNFVGGDPWA